MGLLKNFKRRVGEGVIDCIEVGRHDGEWRSSMRLCPTCCELKKLYGDLGKVKVKVERRLR